MKMWYVYEDWTTEDNPRCYYVGKGDDDRIMKVKRNQHHTNVVSLYGFDRRIVLTTSSEIEALELERKLIVERQTYSKAIDYNGIGCNLTLGGQGNSGRIVTEETCRKISDAKRGKKSTKIWSDAERTATSIRMSNLHKGKRISEEHKSILKARMSDPEIKQDMIDKVSASLKKKYEFDLSFRKRIVETRARGENNPNTPFTEDDVRKMRDEWRQVDKVTKGNRWSGISPSSKFCNCWAERFGVTTQAIIAIVTEKTWKHLL